MTAPELCTHCRRPIEDEQWYVVQPNDTAVHEDCAVKPRAWVQLELAV